LAAKYRVRPPGVARAIVLEADLCGRELVADGADWVRVYAKVCDGHGTVCPLADERIEFSVEGDGRIIGAGHPVCAEAGIATVLVQAGKTAGTIKVSAGAFGLKSGRIEIVSVKQ
jgi:beta-galactosidase